VKGGQRAVLQIGLPANQSCLALRLTQGASLGRYQGCKPVAAQQVCSSTGGGAARAHIISHSLTWRCQSSAVLSSTSARRPLAKRGNRLPAGSTGGLASGYTWGTSTNASLWLGPSSLVSKIFAYQRVRPRALPAQCCCPLWLRPLFTKARPLCSHGHPSCHG